MKPPYEINTAVLHLLKEVSEKLGEVNALFLHKPPAELRKQNRIKTIQASLEIEGNSLSIEQITALVENKRVIGPEKDILEVKNAIEAYSQIHSFQPYKVSSLLKAHGMLMRGLIESAGKFRSRSIGIVKGTEVAHLAPPASNVRHLIQELLGYAKSGGELTLVKSCVFHYELEFIHPFMDGNGRMGRLWQTVLLLTEYPVFEYLPIETLIKDRQQDYYDILSICDKSGSSTLFIEFMLSLVNQALLALLKTQNRKFTPEERIAYYRLEIGKNEFTRKDYLQFFKNISTATASRDLKNGVDKGILKKSGKKRLTCYAYVD